MRFFHLLVPVFSLALVGACVGDDSVSPPADSGPDVTTQDTGIDTGVDTGVDAPVDSSVACEAGTADCDPNVPGCETTLATSDTSCGACGHDCGGKNLCQNGVCTPMAIASGIDKPNGISVNGPSVFWNIDTEIQRCPATGCTTQYPGDVGDGVHFPKTWGYGPSWVVTDSTNVYVPGYTTDNTTYGIYFCALAGCGGNTPVSMASNDDFTSQLVGNTANLYWMNSNNGTVTRIRKVDKNALNLAIPYLTALSDLAADDNHVLITDSSIPGNGGGVYVCNDAITDCVSTHFTLLLDRAQHVATNGTLAVVNQTNGGAIVTCDMAKGCSGSGTSLATGETGVSAIAADAAGVYWAIQGSGSNGTIRMCTLPSCAGGPKTLASGQAQPRSIAVDADFVYWTNQGTATANSGSIMRVRKP